MTGAVDVVIAGHTHSFLNTRVPNREGGGDKLVVEAQSYGAAYDRVRMTVDRTTGEVLAKGADTPTDLERRGHPRPRGGRAGGALPRGARRARATGWWATLAALGRRQPRRRGGAGTAPPGRGRHRLREERQPARLAGRRTGHLRRAVRGVGLRAPGDANEDERPGRALGPRQRDAPPRRRTGAASTRSGSYTVAANRLLVDKGGIEPLTRAAKGAEAAGTDLEALVAEVERVGVLR